MPEHIPENDLPLNQQAKQALKLLRQRPDASVLYVLQLLQWCVDHGKVDLPGPHVAQSVLREQLDTFHQWSPKGAMSVFLENSNQESVEIYPQRPVDDPVELTQALIDQLDSRLTAALPNYPAARVLD